jgi:hypothetical protein
MSQVEMVWQSSWNRGKYVFVSRLIQTFCLVNFPFPKLFASNYTLSRCNGFWYYLSTGILGLGLRFSILTVSAISNMYELFSRSLRLRWPRSKLQSEHNQWTLYLLTRVFLVVSSVRKMIIRVLNFLKLLPWYTRSSGIVCCGDGSVGAASGTTVSLTNLLIGVMTYYACLGFEFSMQTVNGWCIFLQSLFFVSSSI